MPVYNGHKGGRVITTAQANACDGCGRVLPKGSRMTLWTVWIKGFKRRMRFCSDCRGVLYGCETRRSVDIYGKDADGFLCRNICGCCDEYPFCGKVSYQKESVPGDIHFGDLPIERKD